MNTTPATQIALPAWTYLAVSKSTTVQDGAFKTSIVANANLGTLAFLGDAQGVPQVAFPALDVMTSKAVPLDEEVTRADGTKLTVLALLDAILTAAATPAADTTPTA
jgi:hypothetical protein